MFGKIFFGILFSLTGVAAVGYCVYFDMKRRSDPNYKKNVHERRLRERKAAASRMTNEILSDPADIEKYFLNEFKLGENLLSTGHYESGAEHLAKAIVVCNQPERLLQVLQVSLPVEIFALMIAKVQEIGRQATVEDYPTASGNPFSPPSQFSLNYTNDTFNNNIGELE